MSTSPDMKGAAQPQVIARVAPGRGSGPADISFVRFFNTLLRHRRWIVGYALLVLFGTLVVLFARRPTYTAHGSFTPQATELDGGSLAGLGAQLGLNLPNLQRGPSPQFYAELLRSRELLGAVVDTRFEVQRAGGGTLLLVDLLRARGATPELRREDAIERLRRAIGINIGRESQIVAFTVTTRSREMSGAVAARLLELLNEFNLERRQSQAAAERRFTEERLGAARTELTVAEGRLQSFLDENRRFENSPQLTFEHERLQRELLMRQQVVLTLAEAYEQARISEVRNTPVFTVIERPVVPVRGDPRGVVRKGVIAVLVGLLMGTLLGVGLEQTRRARDEGVSDFEEFVALRRAALNDILRPWLMLRRGQPVRSGR